MGHKVYLNALGLLLRVYVRGELGVFEDRLKIVASRVTDQANWYLEWHLDLLILWALAFIVEHSKVEELREGLKSRLSKKIKRKQVMQIGAQLAGALYEFGRGDERKALEFLGSDFDANLSIEVIEKQIKKREGAPFMWRLPERTYKTTGKEEAAIAGEKAMKLEAAYFN